MEVTMKANIPRQCRWGFFLLLLACLALSRAWAHGETNWNDFTIDRVNNQVLTSVGRVQDLIANVVLSEKKPASWPTPVMQQTEKELKELQEDVNDMVDHLVQDGLDVQSAEQLMNNPRAGRGVAASRALQTSLDLLDHAASLAGRDALAKELHTDGLAAYMYDLLDAQKRNMALYKKLSDVTGGAKK